jgi:very-short-patch-repair endonuclease
MHPQDEHYARLRAAHLDEVRRALRRHAGRCVASHESAAIADGLPVFAIPSKAQLTRIDGHRRNGRVRAVAAELPPQDIRMAGDVPATSLARTAVDIARVRPFMHALVTADAVLRRGVPRAELLRVIEAMGQWPGVVNARRVAQWADHRAEAASESVARGRFIELGLELPEPQVVVFTPIGYRTDFYWEAHRLIGEVDGMVKYQTPADLAAEKIRQEHLEGTHVVIRWTWAQIVHTTDAEFSARLQAAMLRGDRLCRLLDPLT